MAVVALVALVLLAVLIGCLLVDRRPRRSAWRRIAEERRRIQDGTADGTDLGFAAWTDPRSASCSRSATSTARSRSNRDQVVFRPRPRHRNEHMHVPS